MSPWAFRLPATASKRMIFSTFEVFRGIADSHPEEIVANAFVALGNYHLEGIPDTPIKPDIERAREMYTYAASYFRMRIPPWPHVSQCRAERTASTRMSAAPTRIESRIVTRLRPEFSPQLGPSFCWSVRAGARSPQTFRKRKREIR
jgi:hypothetical protein